MESDKFSSRYNLISRHVSDTNDINFFLTMRSVLITGGYCEYMKIPTGPDKRTVRDGIINIISIANPNDALVKDFVLETLDLTNKNLVGDEYFDWVINDDLACMWLWHSLVIISTSNLDINVYSAVIEKQRFVFQSHYINLRPISHPSTHKSRCKIIRDFFRTLVFTNPLDMNSCLLLEEYQRVWNGLRRRIFQYKWLESDQQIAATWAFEKAIADKSQVCTRQLFPPDPSQVKAKPTGLTGSKVTQAPPAWVPKCYLTKEFAHHLHPLNKKEAYLAFYALIWHLEALGLDTKDLIADCAKHCNQKLRRARLKKEYE